MKLLHRHLGFWNIFISITLSSVSSSVIPSESSRSTLLSRYKSISSKRSVDVYPTPVQKPRYVWTEWLNCPDTSFAFGLSLNLKRKSPLKGIKLSCRKGALSEQNFFNVTSTINNYNDNTFNNNSFSDETKLGIWSPMGHCENEGLAVGFQLKEATDLRNGHRFTTSDSSPNSTRKGIIDIIVYCYDLITPSKIVAKNANSIIQPARWLKPQMCGWSEFICAFKVQFGNDDLDDITSVRIKCCPIFEPPRGWQDYRGVRGKVLSSESIQKPNLNRVYNHHFTEVLDFPYYFEWEFCPTSTYVTGFQLQFGVRDILLLCSDMRRPEPRMPEKVIRMEKKNSEVENDLSDEHHCDGVAIGIQVKYNNDTGIQAVRFFCSFSQIKSQIPYIEGRFPLWKNGNNTETMGQWQKPQLCGRNQAVCGFKAYTESDSFQHVKVKCCQVPNIAEVCNPTDKYELVVECDSRQALADTTCVYTQSEGLSITHSTNEADRRDEQFHNSIAQEWSINEGVSDRFSESISEGLTKTESTGVSNSHGTSQGESNSRMNSEHDGSSHSSGRTATNSRGSSQGQINTNSKSSSVDVTQGRSSSSGTGWSKSQSHGISLGRTDGFSENNQETSSTDDTIGDSYTKSAALSQGFMSANTKGSSNSQSQGSSSSFSRSGTSGSSNSASHSNSMSDTHGSETGVTASVGVQAWVVSASVAANFQESYSNSKTSGSERSQTSQNSETREQSRQRNDQLTSEQSNSNTNQQTGDQTLTNSASTNRETRRGKTSSNTIDTNRQFTSNQNSEVNSQLNGNSQLENSVSLANRQGTETSRQLNSQTNQENSLSDNEQKTVDRSKTQQITSNNERSKSTSTSQTSDFSSSVNLQKSIDRSSDHSISKTRGRNANEGRQFTTGFDWSRSSSRTFNPEKTTQVSMTVPAKMRTRLYQAVGHCAYYTVQTTKYKRVDDELIVGEYKPEITTGTQEDIDYLGSSS